jgi:hypothetical protein
MRRIRTVLILCLLAAVPVMAQETRGNISGTVQDAQGVVPGATVKISSVDTNVTQVLVTNSTGYFEAPLLQPGRYTITVEMQGFKPVMRENVVLAVGQQINVPFTLEVGGVTEQVTVTAEAPLLDTNSVSSGANFDYRLVDSLPMFGNMPVMLARYAPGVNPNANQPNLSQGFVDGPNAAAGTAIGGVGANTYTIDGATNAGSARRLASSPNADMIQEMRVESSNFDASSGHGLGNQISMMTRAGTSSLRGTANYQYWTNRLNSLNEQQKRTFDAEARRIFDLGRSHNTAFTLGGPVYIPGVIDGRGRMFFFGNYSYVNDSIPGRNQGTSTVPANRKHLEGDFSDLLQLPNPNQYRIHDPLTARTDPNNPNRVIRDPFPNNVIPRDRIFNPDGSYRNPLMGIYAAAVPPPNQNFLSPTQQPTGNYFRGGEPNTPVSHLFGGRLDYNHSGTDRFFFRMSGSTFDEGAFDWTYESPTPQFRNLHNGFRERYTWSYTGNWTRTVAGATVIDTQVSSNRYFQQDKYRNLAKYKPSDFGLPLYMDQFCEARGGCAMPRVTIDGYQALSVGANDGDTVTNVQGQVNVTHVRSAHTWRGGVDLRRAARYRTGGGNRSGAFSFTRAYTRQASDESQLTANNIGLSLAAFMLGVPTSVQMEDQTPADFYNHFFGAYGQDTWRIGRNLTINGGLRFEYEDGIREDESRMLVGFNPDAETSITQVAEASYLASGIANTPGMLPSIRVRGGAVYATDPGQDGTTWKGQAMWMPRLSWAYKLGERTVLKGGWGVYYDTLNANDSDPSQTGYNVTTVNNSSNDLGRTFLFSMFDPFPVRLDGSRFETPVGASLGYDSVLGTNYSPENQLREHARQQRWRVSVQREVARNLGIEIAYNGSYSDRIGRSIRQDYLPEAYWNDSNERNATANAFLTANVSGHPFRLQNFTFLQTSNPTLYQRMAANTFFTSPTVQRNRLLRAFPHMTDVTYVNLPVGEVKVHALEIMATRRYSAGLSAVGSFSVTRVRENRTVHEFDRAPTIWQGSNGGRPFRFAGSAVYELPFGAGRQFLNAGGVLPAIVGGWQIAGTYDYQPGSLLGDWPNLFFYGNLDDIAIDNPTRDRWFNTDAGFEKDPARTPAGFQKRKFPFRVDGVRGQALSVLSVSLSRSVELANRRTVQLRVDAQNLLNRQHWNNANITPTSTDFGKVTTVSGNFMRFITFGIKLSF